MPRMSSQAPTTPPFCCPRMLMKVGTLTFSGILVGANMTMQWVVAPSCISAGPEAGQKVMQPLVKIAPTFFGVIGAGQLVCGLAAYVMNPNDYGVGVATLVNASLLPYTFYRMLPINDALGAEDAHEKLSTEKKKELLAEWPRRNVLRTVISTTTLAYLTWAAFSCPAYKSKRL